MNKLISLLLVSAIIVVVGVLGLLHFWKTTTPDTIEQSQELAKLRLHKEIRQLELLLQQEISQYTLLQQKLENDIQIEQNAYVSNARTLAAVLLVLWPAWLGLGVLFLCFSQRHHFQKQTTFETENIKAVIPLKNVTRLTERALQVQETEANARIAAFQEELQQARVKELATLTRALKPLLKHAEPIETTIVETQALPAFSGPVYYSQCRQDADFDENAVCVGRNLEDGGLIQIPFEELQSMIKTGLQGQGKTVLTLLEVFSALYRKYVLQDKIRLHLIDKHYGFDESLTSRLQEYCPDILSLCDSVILGPEIADDNTLLSFLDTQIKEGKARQAKRDHGADPLDVIIFDEYTETVTSSKQGTEIEERVKTLFNYRKAGKYVSLVLFEAVKNKNSVKGLNVAKMGISKILFATDPDEAGRFLGWQHKDLIEGLQKGQCLLKLANQREVVKTQVALIGAIDFMMFQKFVEKSDHQQGPAPMDATGDQHPTTSEPPESDPGDAITGQDITSFLESQGLSQRKFAKQTGISQTKISDFVNGKDRLSEEEKILIQHMIAPVFEENSDKIVNLNQYRK